MSTYTPDDTQGDGEVRCPWDGCDESYENERYMKIHHKAAHGESIADRPNQVERRNPDSGIPCPWDGCDREFRNELGRQQHHAKTHGESIRGVELECDECGESFRINKQRADDDRKGRFCSRGCAGKWYSQQFAREDHPSWNREELTCEWCGETYQIPQSEADRSRFCSKDCKDAHHSEAMRGESNPFWKGGHDWNYGRGWPEQRRKALERDGYECQICGMADEEHIEKNGRSLDVHHIMPRAEFDDKEKADRLDNLVTLCRKHHRQWEGVPVFPESKLT